MVKSTSGWLDGMAVRWLTVFFLFLLPAFSPAANLLGDFLLSTLYAEVAGVVKEKPIQQKEQPVAIQYPVFIGELPNPNDFILFANGGNDGHWYVGYDRCWISKQFVSTGNYKRAFLGAKLGRMKNFQVVENGKPKLKWKAYPGEIYISINSTAKWGKNNSYFLVTTDEIPSEPSGDFLTSENTGESQWFWVEIPLSSIKFGAENFIALWSPSPELVSISSTPILAAGLGSENINTWLTDKVKGAPPEKFGIGITTITFFEPAISIKLVGNIIQKIDVSILNVSEGEDISEQKSVYVSVMGKEIEKVSLDISYDGKNWQRLKNLYTPPYIFTLKPKDLQDGNAVVRVVVKDIWENIGFSPLKKIKLTKKEK